LGRKAAAVAQSKIIPFNLEGKAAERAALK